MSSLSARAMVALEQGSEENTRAFVLASAEYLAQPRWNAPELENFHAKTAATSDETWSCFTCATCGGVAGDTGSYAVRFEDAGDGALPSPRSSRMRLTMMSDFALRVLLFAAAHPDRLVKIDETQEVNGISGGHLMKIVGVLATAGILRSQRGRTGGFTLGLPAERIRLGDVLRLTEPDLDMVECFVPDRTCAALPFCKLPGVVTEALAVFMGVMDRYTLADLVIRPQDFGMIAAAKDERPAQ